MELKVGDYVNCDLLWSGPMKIVAIEGNMARVRSLGPELYYNAWTTIDTLNPIEHMNTRLWRIINE